MQANPNPVLKRLNALIGKWDTRMFQDGQQVGHAETAFAWQEDGAFLVQRVHVPEAFDDVSPEWMERGPFPVVAYIGLDDQEETFTMLYADARRVYRVYQMGVDESAWTASRSAPGFHQRFHGTFSGDGRRIDGYWEGSPDGSKWERDFDITYTKVD